MKLTAFRIRNYRAIVDTGWIKLSQDNITTIIGQNESGKTTVLEALYSFYTGSIHEDILRSDLTLPDISCSFYAEKTLITSILDPNLLKPEVYEKVLSSGLLFINRKWTDQNNSQIFFGDDELTALHNNELTQEKKTVSELEETIHLILEETSKHKLNHNQLEKEKQESDKVHANLVKREAKAAKTLKKNLSENKKKEAEADHKKILEELENVNKQIENINNTYDTSYRRLNELVRASKYAELFLISGRTYKSAQENIEMLEKEEGEKRLEIKFCTESKKLLILNKQIKDIGGIIVQKKDEIKQIKEKFEFYTDCLSLALTDNPSDNIEEVVVKNRIEKQKILSPEDIGQLVFNYIPLFKIFEDFSSLLPNRIDLDDIIDMNTKVEGYNAVKNFLIVSGLDASFFSESSSRIMKQKIENLNGEITLNFQDYWRQSVGRNNKIKINFELEHYDFSHPAKKGKPYLEFWIKDEHERLYPKQRSRGVRWFLSFYLELKATSLQNNSGYNLLLIDEPGLSLHARAQEDVLKVFEDLKDNMQILYSTHSPNLVDVSKLYRVLAIQRADEYNDKSASLIFDSNSLGNASSDTLSPVYSLIGTRISDSNFLQERNNIIVEDIHVFYYLSNIFKIFGGNEEIFFLPSNGISNIPILVNIMTGWNLHYIVLLNDNEALRDVYKILKVNNFRDDENLIRKKVMITKDLPGLENLFSTLDFKKHILQKRVGITESNLEYIGNNGLSRKDMATSFSLRCQNQVLKPSDFDDETQDNVNNLITAIMKMIRI